MDPRNTTISMYTWGVLAAGALLILGAVWWASASGPTTPPGTVYAQPRDEQPVTAALEHQAAVPPPIATLPDLPSGMKMQPIAKPMVRVTPAPKPTHVRQAKLPGSPYRDMFPVPRVTTGTTQAVHPYMEVPELFPSFYYDQKMWTASGTFAWSNQVELAPIGREIEGRRVYALRNLISGPNVLFVPSEQDPDKYAIYR